MKRLCSVENLKCWLLQMTLFQPHWAICTLQVWRSLEESVRNRKKVSFSWSMAPLHQQHIFAPMSFIFKISQFVHLKEPRAKEPLEGKLQNSVETCRQPFISTSTVSKIFAPSMRIILALHFIAIKEVVPPLPHFFRISCPFHVDFLLCFISI